uniref:Formylglycine-generating enzyme, required for sulfatase activity, contains SUMF1/FGE domain n=1 Tax=Candidatus Kentrum sp. SD TaxID=2126332 RepID=A0A451BMF2_9GAMM|nr:MAG: Formylglycine-generating enzyme, required for sulfatase activity, contains SUMF1/FGE domain [Candidatus Kentron sp. SD]
MEKEEKSLGKGMRAIEDGEEILSVDDLGSDKVGGEPDAGPDKATYDRNLHHYEVTFSRALEKTYPEIDRTVREQLQRRSRTLGLAAEDVARIEHRVTEKAVAYRANLQQYRQAFRGIIREEYPVARQTRRRLQQQERILALRGTDVAAIEKEVAGEKIANEIKLRHKDLRHRPQTTAIHKNAPETETEVKEDPIISVTPITSVTPVAPKPFPANKVIGIVVSLLLAVGGVALYLSFQEGSTHSPRSGVSPGKEISHAERQATKSTESTEPPKLAESTKPAKSSELTESAESTESAKPTGRVIIRSNVSEDNVYIDGRSVGPTGPKVHRLSAGEHRIRVEKSGYEPLEIKITLAPNGEEKISAELIPEIPSPGKIFQDKLKNNSLGPKMIVLPAGEFLMGSSADESMRYDGEGPRHRVRIARPFALGVTGITFDDYDRFAKATGRRLPRHGGWGRGKQPVINVSWYDAKAYAKWLTKQTDGGRYRLPTEAEWEYAARAGTTTPFFTGKCIHTDQANYKGDYDYANCGAKTGVSRGKPVPAGSMPSNPWGLHEMLGNVWEWTADCWHYDYKDAPTDGSVWGKENKGYCSERVVRGGGWRSGPRSIRSAVRIWDWADVVSADLGFRLVKVLQTEKSASKP